MMRALKRLLPVRVKEFKWLPHGASVPRGWTVGENVRGLGGSHHNVYGVLIFRNRWVWQ